MTLSKNGVRRTQRIHRLVLEAFVGPAPEGMECLHGDGDPANAALSNLRWGTSTENEDDKRRHGTRLPAGSREKCPSGHRLVEPNLVRCNLPEKRCLACHRARCRRYKAKKFGRPLIDVRQEADRVYGLLMRGVDGAKDLAVGMDGLSE